MTALLVAVLVALIGARLRVRPSARSLPISEAAVDVTAPQPWRSWRRRVGHLSTSRVPDPSPHDAAIWCDDIARAVGSGSTLATAVRQIEPPRSCATVIDPIRLSLARGVALDDAADVPTRSPDLRLALTVIGACAEHGGPAAEPLGRTAATLRGRAAEAAERRTQSAQARMSAVVMTILPVSMLMLLLLTSGSVRHFIASRGGLVVVAVGAVLNVVGWRWMGRLINGRRS